MPDNPSPAAQPEPTSDSAEFDFDKPPADNPRLKRRNLKAKATTDLKPASAPEAARELEREAPPLSAEKAASRPVAPLPDEKATTKVGSTPVTKPATVAPPRTTPTVSAAAGTPAPAQRPATTSAPATTSTNSAATKPATTAGATSNATGQKVNIALTAQQKASVPAPSQTASPHGTRPATLYYSSYPKKETSASMKPTTNASAASTGSPASSSNHASAAARPAAASTSSPSAARPTTMAGSPGSAATRPSTINIDYRANVERQSREQRSVGNILAYFVYGLLAVVVVGAALAIYGSVIIFDKLHDESTSISDLDANYALKMSALDKQLASTQDSLAQSQATITRQQDLINKEQEDLNRLLAQLNDQSSALKAESKARAQETATLRARVRDLEYKASTTTQKY